LLLALRAIDECVHAFNSRESHMGVRTHGSSRRNLGKAKKSKKSPGPPTLQGLSLHKHDPLLRMTGTPLTESPHIRSGTPFFVTTSPLRSK
jgi:hypothetical protein